MRNLSPVFRDRDTIDPINDSTVAAPHWVNHYTANPRVFYRADIPDLAPQTFSGQAEIEPPDLTPRKITSVRRPSDVFAIWDAPQIFDQLGNSYGLAEAIDAWGWYNSSAMCYDTPITSFIVARPILPGQKGQSGREPGKLKQQQYNIDALVAFGGNGWLSHLRFRHMNNTRLAALCLDGHVETARGWYSDGSGYLYELPVNGRSCNDYPSRLRGILFRRPPAGGGILKFGPRASWLWEDA